MKTKLSLIVLVLTTLLATACKPTASQSSPTIDTILTAQQATLYPLETLLAVTPSVVTTDTATPVFTTTNPPTSIPLLTSTPIPTPIPTQTYAPVAASCNQATFVMDVTIPDGTVIAPTTTFTKTWRLLNSGSCTWSTDYKLVYMSGSQMGGPSLSNLSASVAPGQTIDISINLTSPAATGSYQGNYQLEDASGNIFGLGAGGSAFDVVIQVGPSGTASSTSSSLAVTSVALSVVNSSDVITACPPGYAFTFDAAIVANAGGTVSYNWTFSDGTSTPEQSVTYSAAGSQTVSITWVLGANGTIPTNPYNGSASIYIDTPNHQTFGPQSISIGCVFPSPTSTLSFTPTFTPQPSATDTITPQLSATPTSTTQPSATPTMTSQPSATPTLTPRPSATFTPTT